MTGGSDVLVVGAGAAGCVVAARLSEDPKRLVTLLEAGGSDANPLFRVPLMTGILLRSRDGGDSWAQVDVGGPVPHTMFKIAFDERRPSLMSCATNGGEVWTSRDAGESWTQQPPPPDGFQIYALARG